MTLPYRVPRGLREALPVLTALALSCLPSNEVTASPPEPPAAEISLVLVSRLKAALLLETLNAELLSHESATATLDRWCSAHGIGSPVVVAERIRGVQKVPTAEQRRELRVSDQEAVRYRRVRLRCGAVVVSEADNWYVPSRLTAEMNRLLDTTDTPFGRVVKSLDFQRHTISATILSPFLPEGWEALPPGRIERMGKPCLPAYSLQHRAILTLRDGTPFSEVVETYTGNVLTIPAAGLTDRCPS